MSATTSTTETKAATPMRNPKDSLKSTWRTWDRSQWSFYHWPYEIFNIHHVALGKDIPVHQKTDPVPHLRGWTQHRWVLFHSSIPLVLHQAYVHYTGQSVHPVAVAIFYALAFKLIVIHEFNMLRGLAHKLGFYDGDKHERDGVPDHAVWEVLNSLVGTSTTRVAASVFLTYYRQAPSTINWVWLPLEIGFYGIILDFWFYWYHRLMHDNATLWKYHRTHHLTKHPNPLLTLYADHEQEFFDIIGIPLMTWGTMKLMGFPMEFYDWWYCHQYVVFAEIAGHSGLRVHARPPSTMTWLLALFNAELVIEDHDLHHRFGWKHSFNYGKQTRLWDRIFGTCRDRIEAVPGNVDYENKVSIPLF